jgi:hypothetical protein
MHDTTISMHQSYLKSRILEVVVTDQHYLHVKESLQQENVRHKIKEYEMKEDGLLMHKNKIYVPCSGELRNFAMSDILVTRK